MVISIGEKSFTVNVPRLGITTHIFLDKIPDTVSTFDEAERTLVLQATSTVTHTWVSATIKIMSKIFVRCAAAAKPGPVEIQLEFLRPK